jgi:predicted nuclease with TOPRIM domain
MRRPDAQPSPSPTESPIVAWLTGAAVKQAIAKAARSLAEGKSEDVIAQVGSLVVENALLKSDNAVLRNEIASLAKRLDKVRAELDAIKRAVARGLNKEDFEFSSHRSIIDEIVGKGYGHTDSGERLLRMHAQEVVARPRIRLRISSGRLGLSLTKAPS